MLSPKFSLCCSEGKMQLPPLRIPPEPLKTLFDRNAGKKSLEFLKNIRKYNSMFAFASMGRQIDNSINNGRGPYVFRLHGKNYQCSGLLLPGPGWNPAFAQLYVHYTENEVSSRISYVRHSGKSDSIDAAVITDLKQCLMKPTHWSTASRWEEIDSEIILSQTSPCSLQIPEKKKADSTILQLHQRW